MRELTFGMNRALDGYVARPGDDLGWSVLSEEMFQWWSDRNGATSLAWYGRRLWKTKSTGRPPTSSLAVTPAQIEFARPGRTSEGGDLLHDQHGRLNSALTIKAVDLTLPRLVCRLLVPGRKGDWAPGCCEPSVA
jgi:hypothetical protein